MYRTLPVRLPVAGDRVGHLMAGRIRMCGRGFDRHARGCRDTRAAATLPPRPRWYTFRTFVMSKTLPDSLRVARFRYEAGMSDDPEPADGGEPHRTGVSRRRLLTTGAAAALVGAGVGVGAGRALMWSQPRGLTHAAPRSGTSRIATARRRWAVCTCNSARMPVPRWWCHGTPPTPSAIRESCWARRRPVSASTVAAETRTYRDAKSNNEVRVNHARLTNLTPDTDYVYAAVHDGADPGAGDGTYRADGTKTIALHQFRRSVHSDARQVDQRQLRHRQHRIARGRRYHDGDRARRPAVQPGQRRPVLRQPGAGPDPHLVGLV